MAFLSKEVMHYRLGNLREFMAKNALDSVIVTQADFFQFYTNYQLDVQTWERPVALVIPREGEPFALLNALSTNHCRMAADRSSLWIGDITFYFEFPQSNSTAPQGFTNLLSKLLADHGLNSGQIGHDASAALLEKSLTQYSDVSLVSVKNELHRQRWVKHPEEIILMRQAADISDWLQEHYRQNIRPGRLVKELDLAMQTLAVEEGARRFPGENLEWRIYTLSGPASAAPHGDGAQTGARISKGDVLVNIVIPRLNGVTVENERTWFCGQPSRQQMHAFEAARRASEVAVESLVTGRPVSDVDKAARAIFTEAGLEQYVLHRTGHGMGLLGHEFPEDMPYHDRALIENEVYSAEPGIYMYGVGGFRIDDTVVVGDEPEILTKAPKDLDSQTISCE